MQSTVLKEGSCFSVLIENGVFGETQHTKKVTYVFSFKPQFISVSNHHVKGGSDSQFLESQTCPCKSPDSNKTQLLPSI